MVFAHRHYLKAGRDTWVHRHPCAVSTLATFAESSWNGTANCSGPITGGWVLITRGWGREGRGSLLRGPQDAKGGFPTRLLDWRSTLTCHPQQFSQPQAKTRQLLTDMPGLWEGTDIGWGWRQSRVKRGEKGSYGGREGAVTKDKKWKPEPPV